MRRNLILFGFGLALAASVFSAGLAAQCNPPNISATIAYANVPIGKDLVIDYVTPRTMNGKFIYTVASLYSGSTPIGGGSCLALAPPFYLMGVNFIAANKARFRFTVPKEKSLIGLNLYLGGLVVDGTPLGTGASGGVLAHIRQEDWPLP